MKWNKEQESILNDTIKMVEKWCIESRVKELGLVTKKLMENKEPIDVLDLLKWIGNRKEKLEAGIFSIPLEAEVNAANAFVESAKNAIDKAHTLALKFAVLRNDKVYSDEIYSNWQEAHIKFQEELKRLSG